MYDDYKDGWQELNCFRLNGLMGYIMLDYGNDF